MEEKAKVKNFTDLEAWKTAHALTTTIYSATKKFPREELFGMVSQTRRAAVSIGSNIVEGFSRNSPKDKAQFYEIAKGSTTELHNQLLVSRDIGYLMLEEYEEFSQKLAQTNKFITGLLKYLRTLAVLVFPLILYTAPFIPVAHASTLSMPGNSLGLVGYWTFDEGSGTTAADHSGNGNTGTLVNSPSWTSGKRGSTISFTGANYVQTASAGVTGTAARTVTMWVNTTQTSMSGNSTDLLEYGSGTCDGHYLVFTTNDKYGGATNYAGLSVDQTCTGAVTYAANGLYDGSWHLVAFVLPASATLNTIKIYLDGTLLTSVLHGGGTTPINTGTGSGIRIGSALQGSVDDVRVYNRALSAAEVAGLYQQTAPVRVGATQSPSSLSSGLVGHWTFDGKDMQQNVADTSGSGNNGDLVGYTSTTTTMGVIGQALSFDGSNDSVQGPSFSALAGSHARAVSLWFKTSSATSQELADSGQACSVNNQAFLLQVAGSGSVGASPPTNPGGLYLSYRNNDLYVYNGIGSVADGKWHNVTVMYDGSKTWIYFDGTLPAVYHWNGSAWSTSQSQPYTVGAVSTAQNPLWVGKTRCGLWFGSISSLLGSVDDVRIYDRTLSAAEIKQLYNLGQGTHGNASGVQLQEGSSLASGLVGYWTFDGADVTDKVYDKSGSGSNGYFVGGATSSAKTIGKLGQALSFNGSDYVLDPSVSAISGANARSISLWFKTTKKTGEALFDGGVCGSTNHAFFLSARPTPGIGTPPSDPGGFELIYWGNDIYVYNGISNVADGKWHHVVVVYDGSKSWIYFDTALPPVYHWNGTGWSTSTAQPWTTGTVITTLSPLEIGKGNCDGSFVGSIDDVRIYNRALSASEVQQLYNLGH